ncbi:MAG: aspartate kinase [Candidatus Cloacimonetes bacterium]|jgi:aspartate kinase|nr:aspartate kinase [Candidatus Cloacimonadota bacterium]MDD2422945.1 aspartate kinase [Candidatus Cloacimonadota bacterium]MDD4276385.1 aspartate kinase [Candidatus Cloacimonadota bacterium]MDY0325275.1 aspartate kinase [Candidatus Cloacimonadaceae bacterium]
MAIIVKKFGGSSVGSVPQIQAIAKKLARDYHRGDQLVLVVSAMAKTTDNLFSLAYEITKHPSRREMDMLLTAGERISMSLLSLSLLEEGIPSISFTGSQSGIITDDHHGNAKILKVNAFRIHEELAKDKVVIVAGFQGVSLGKEITTLGRGGSDTSAVALACYLGAERCEIYTDVAGVYSADPRIVPQAKLLPEISYLDMLALAYSGSKVLHPRAVEFASKYKVPVEVKSSLSFAPGTIIKNEESPKDIAMEELQVNAIAHKENILRYQIPPDAKALLLLNNWKNEIFKISRQDDVLELYIEAKYEPEIDYLLSESGYDEVSKDRDLGFVILVGLGLAADPAFMAKVMKLTEDNEVKRISHGERSLELMLPSQQVAKTLVLLHQEFLENK